MILKSTKIQISDNLSPNDTKIIKKIQSRSYEFDYLFKLFGFPVGLNSLIGLIPIFGSIFILINSFYIYSMTFKFDHRLPLKLQFKLILNILIEFLINLFPIIGQLFLINFKSNTINSNLILTYLNEMSQLKYNELLQFINKDNLNNKDNIIFKKETPVDHHTKHHQLSKDDDFSLNDEQSSISSINSINDTSLSRRRLSNHVYESEGGNMDTASVLEQYTQDLSNLPAELAHLLTELRDKDMKYYETRKRLQQRDNQLHKHIKQFGSLNKNPKETQIYNKINEDFDKLFKLQEEKCILSNTAIFVITKHLIKLENDITVLENEGLLLPLELLEQELSLNSALNSINSLNLTQNNHHQHHHHKRQPSSRKHSHQPSLPQSQSPTPSLNQPSSRHSTPMYRPTQPPQQHLLNQQPKRQMMSMLDDDDEMLVSDSDLVSKRKLQPPNLVLLSSMHPSSIEVQITGPGSVNGAVGGEEDELYCFCRQVSFGNMIACDNDDCKFEWFHYDCVGLKEPPQGTWYCPDCAKIMGGVKNRKKKQ